MYSGLQIRIITRNELDTRKTSSNEETYAEDEIDSYTDEYSLGQNEPETDFTKESKSCQPPCTEQFPILRTKERNDDLIEYYLQYQPEEIKTFIKQFNFRYTDLEDEELAFSD